MKKLIVILILSISAKGYSQFATKAYVDSLFRTLDSVIVKPPKQTNTSNTIVLDTLVLKNNTSATFQILVETDNDNIVKDVFVRNNNGTYSIIDDSDEKSFSHNRQGIFNITILYSVSSALVNNSVIITAKGRTNVVMNWTLSRTRL